MLRIDSLKKGKNVIKGSSELKIMQNNYTPILDLLVRESIQNSLDAKKDDVDIVHVKFLHDSFDVNSLYSEFETVGEEMKNKYQNEVTEFIAITDKNTVGLTGDLSGEYEEEDRQNQNLGRLVFHIMEEQQREGAGGSWGIGKTLYYRIGAGLVIYYSRVKEGGTYQNRLVAAIVEDERKKDGLLSKISGNVGVAWFGNKSDGENIKAITDDRYIEKFLKIFNMTPLIGNETGTFVIIPFIKEKELLENNLSEYAEKAWWNDNIEDYLYVSTLRWYFPRFSKKYKNGPRLSVSINDAIVEASDKTNTILYKKYIELYDAFYEKKPKDWIKVETIERKNYLLTNNVGKFMYGIVNKKEIGVSKHHLPNPKQYALKDDYDTAYPLICYCRNAGMITNYESFSKNLTTLNCPDDSYIIGLFVVDPNNCILSTPTPIKLDEYLRSSEKSDHSSWEDHIIPGYKKTIRIVEGIYKSIAKFINSSFCQESIIQFEPKVDISLARKFGRLFLPDAGYGTDPRKASPMSNGNGSFTKIGNNKIKLTNTIYRNGNLILGYEIAMKEKATYIKFDNMINTVGKKYTAKEWIDEGFEYPCNIRQISLQCIMRNGKKVNEESVLIKKDEKHIFESYVFEFLCVDNNCYSFVMNKNDESLDEIGFRIFIEISNKDKTMQTYCNVEFGGKQR